MRKSFFENIHERFFFLYGNTHDEYCSDDLKFRKLDELIFYQLKSKGYERIALYNPKNKIYTYEKTSYDIILDSKKKFEKKLKTNSLIPKGPLGKRGLLLAKASKDTIAKNNLNTRNGVYSFGLMNDLNVVAKLDEIMQQKEIKTAVILSDAFDFFNNFEANARRQMAANFTSWLNFGHENNNICIFILPDLQGEQFELIFQRNQQWQFLYSKMFNLNNHLSDSVYPVSYPLIDEIKNTINYYRIKYDYKIDWAMFDEYLPKITSYSVSNKISLQEFARILNEKKDFSEKTFTELSGVTLNEESAAEKLSKMRGINVIKDKIDDFIDEINELRGGADNIQAEIIKIPHFFLDRVSVNKKKTIAINLHLALKGSPGTGKTTIARLLGEIFRENGLLKLGHLVKASREDLVAAYVGHTAIKTSQLINQAMGGILFVDEAYRLLQGGENDFGMEALETILEAMENHKGEFSVIFAGYPKHIDEVINSNPGFKSRFSEHNIITIPNFNSDVLYEILKDTILKNKKNMTDELSKKLPLIINKWHAANQSDEDFGNARAVKEDVYKGMDNKRRKRIRNSKNNEKIDINKFILDDIPNFMRKYISINSKSSFEEVLEELNSMTGLNSVKNQINKLIKGVKLNKIREKKGLKVLKNQNLHMLFIGNPGTGKTTVARLMGKLLNGLGVLPSDKLLDVSAKDLIANVVGDSEVKAQKLIEDAMGGILFIDEIYGLTEGSLGESYGKDVINNVLVPAMTKYNGNLLIIGAGYSKEMNNFLNNNSGLDRRFSRKIIFDDFTSDELFTVIKNYAKKQEYILDERLKQALLDLFLKTKKLKKENFGNAGDAINCFNLMVENLGERILENENVDLSKDDLVKLLAEDIPERL